MGAASSLECVARDRNGSSAPENSAEPQRGGTTRSTGSTAPAPAAPLGFQEQWNAQMSRMRRLAWGEDAHSTHSADSRLGPTFGASSKDLAKLLPGHSELLKQVLWSTHSASTTDEEATGLLVGMAHALTKVAEGAQEEVPPSALSTLDSLPGSASAMADSRLRHGDQGPPLDSSPRGGAPKLTTKALASQQQTAQGQQPKALEVLDGIFLQRQNEGYARKVAATLLERHLGQVDPADAEVITWPLLQDMVE
eukprot:911836-Amphidinium_carterae.1